MLTVSWSGREADLPVLDDLDEIVELVQRGERLYIRYSEGPDRDREGPTRDYESGLVLPGLSVTLLNPPEWWTTPAREWIARRICKYADLMRGPRQPRPWLLTGRVVGIGPDHEPLLAECSAVAWVGSGALADAAQLYQRRFAVGQDARSLAARVAAMSTPDVRASDTRCPFCFPAAIAPHQLLVMSEHFHLLALAGQVVEGFLGIMTNACRDGPTRLRCIDDIPVQWVDELEALIGLVARFYLEAYGAPALLYEHGRGGGGRSSLPGGDFVFHPHLCAVPGNLTLHEPLRARFAHRGPVRLSEVRTVIGRRPYLYVHTPADACYPDPTVYYAEDPTGDQPETLSLKQLLIDANSLDADADWRRSPGQRELANLVDRFNAWYAPRFRRPGDPRLAPPPE